VHVASRVGAAAKAGEILVTVRRWTASARRIACPSRARETLKGLEHPVEVVSVAWR
jgi:class 3 adenylate cyclase